MYLIAKSKHNDKRQSEVIGITSDGWVITKDGTFGDLGQDCEIELDMKNYLLSFRKQNHLTQQELSWMLGKSRPTIIELEKGKGNLTLKDFLILAAYLPDTEFTRLKKKLLTNHP